MHLDVEKIFYFAHFPKCNITLANSDPNPVDLRSSELTKTSVSAIRVTRVIKFILSFSKIFRNEHSTLFCSEDIVLFCSKISCMYLRMVGFENITQISDGNMVFVFLFKTV